MNELLQRWLMLTLPLRMLWLLMLSLGLLALTWIVLLRPQQQMREAQARQLEQMRQQQQQRLQQLASLPAIDVLQSEISLLQPTKDAGTQQTLERIVAARGSQLEAWHPDSQPQQLQLRLAWPQFLPLFSELASTRLPVPQRFQLHAEQGVLNTQLWLESDDAE